MPPVFTRLASRSWFWFGVAFLLFGIHVFTSRFHTQVYDANGYWQLAQDLYQQNNFSLLNFRSGLRGCLFPLLYVPVVALDQAGIFFAETLIKLLGVLLAAGLTAGLVPALWQRVSGQRVGAGRRALFIGVVFLLWRDYFNYTLTDFPALAGLGGALYLLHGRPTAGRLLLAGALAAFVVNIRPIYLVALPFLVLLGSVAVSRATTQPWHKTTGRFLLAFTAGFLLTSGPQWLINYRNFGVNRPLVIGIDFQDPGMVEAGDLYLLQMNAGFSMQKYETGIAADYPIPQVRYQDPAGTQLLQQNFNHKIDSYGEYLQVVAQHPADMVALNGRHLFNGLDVLYPTPYLYRVYTNTAVLAWINYTLLFLAGTVLLVRGQRLSRLALLTALPLLIPAFTAIPLPMECRYMLPLHWLLLAGACFGWPAAWTWRGLAGRRLALGLTYGAFVTACFVLSAHTQALLAEAPKLITP
ncbi:hypothetical protein KLP40_13930 [Hymenobacter sp. NST-14]|uniref:hypothetical protein n=1 Tax=Hymenobacter piscis TaxID=2839984 RepID=UPI001C00958D|nr:hypothetical protein [Hymenobacter piscis]MBT9394266.1 hypothetical protein [Hymenobacter piscis]